MAWPSPLRSAACAALGWLMLGASDTPARQDAPPAESLAPPAAESPNSRSQALESLAPPAAESLNSRSQALDRVPPVEGLASSPSDSPSDQPNRAALTIPPIADADPFRLATKPGESAASSAVELETLKLEAAIRNAPKDSPERARLTERLKAAVEWAFDFRQQQQLADVERLEKQLRQARERIEQRQKLRERIVERRIQGLTGDDNLEWEGNPLGNILRSRNNSNPFDASASPDATSLPEIPPASRPLTPSADPAAITGTSSSRSPAAEPLTSLPRGNETNITYGPDTSTYQSNPPRGNETNITYTPDISTYQSNYRVPFDIYSPPNDLVSAMKKAKTKEERSVIRARFRIRRDFLAAELKATALELKSREDSADAPNINGKKEIDLRTSRLRDALRAYEEHAKDLADPDLKPEM